MKSFSAFQPVRLMISLGILLLINSSSSAQMRHGVHLLSGISKIHTANIQMPTEPTEIEILNNFDFSMTLGYTAVNNFKNDLSLQFGVDVLFLNAKRSETYAQSENHFDNFDLEMSGLFVSAPVLIGIKKENISILTGIRTTVFLGGTTDMYRMGETSGLPFEMTRRDDLESDRLDAGHHTELKYGLGDNLEVVISFYYGVNALFKTDIGESYYHQISLGVGYLFN